MLFQSRGSSRERRPVTSAVIALVLFGLNGASAGARPDNRADIAIIDRALATEKPGDRWIEFGDVGLGGNNWKFFARDSSRNKLARNLTWSHR